jgi:hypothetical protein
VITAFFIRLWYEVDLSNTGFGYSSREESKDTGKRWFPYQKGGSFVNGMEITIMLLIGKMMVIDC